MYLARELTDLSLAEIARGFDRDHTTVLHAIRRCRARLEPGSDTAVADPQGPRRRWGQAGAPAIIRPPMRGTIHRSIHRLIHRLDTAIASQIRPSSTTIHEPDTSDQSRKMSNPR